MIGSMDKEMQARIAETKTVTPLLQGAIDMHYHGYPEITLGFKSRVDDLTVLELGKEMGMRGIVIKSQMWPSMGRAYHLTQRIQSIECFSSITLNPLAGGLNPWVVDAAARQGAKMVWLPTWSSTHKLGKRGFSIFLKTWFPSITFEPGQTCTGPSGKVTPEVQSIIGLVKSLNMVLGTGHISPMESLAVAEEAERIGFTKLVFTHPLSGSVGATKEQIKEMIKRGAYAEFCALNVFYGNELDLILEILAEVDPARCILSSDAFMEWVPPAPEFFRMFIGRLLISGIDEESIMTMVRDNPAKLLDLSPVTSDRRSTQQ